jgi:transposase
VLRLRLVPDESTTRRLDAAFVAIGHLERALTRWALTNLDSMRRTTRWHAACAMATGLSPSGEVTDPAARKVRNSALNALRCEFRLTEYDFKKRILELRRDSYWIGDHVPSQSALAHAAQVWESFAAHLFRSAGRPEVPRPWQNQLIEGASRDEGRGPATQQEVERAEAKGKRPPKARKASWSGVSLRVSGARGITVHLHPSHDWQRHLAIPVVFEAEVPTAREAWYLDDPATWRRVKIVKREVRRHFVYEAHLLCAKDPYRDPARYRQAPDSVVGIDLGVSTLAAVGVGANGVITDALLVRPSIEEMEQRRLAARQRRRAQRALERSRRSINPDAYGPDRHGRPGRGSRLPGTRLRTSKSYHEKRRQLRDERRRERGARIITTNMTATSVIARCGKHVITEDVSVKGWQVNWGKSLSYFAPSELLGAIEREARLAGGSFTKVPCRLGLTQSCHCGAVQEKSLAERWHRCSVCQAGFETPPVDRDVHSAYLAAFVTSSPLAVTLDTDRALAAWSGAEAPLVAVSGDPQSRRTIRPHSHGTSRWSRRKSSDRAGRAIASDVDPHSLGRAQESVLCDVGVGKAHAARLRYEEPISETGRPLGRQLRLDG